MLDRHDNAPGTRGTGGEASTTGKGGTNQPAPTVATTGDIPADLRRRRQAATRSQPLPDGHRDPLDAERLATPAPPCSLGFACLSKPLDVHQRLHHCPCVEAHQAVAS